MDADVILEKRIGAAKFLKLSERQRLQDSHETLSGGPLDLVEIPHELSLGEANIVVEIVVPRVMKKPGQQTGRDYQGPSLEELQYRQ